MVFEPFQGIDDRRSGIDEEGHGSREVDCVGLEESTSRQAAEMRGRLGQVCSFEHVEWVLGTA
jgi:hypothetical protein